MNTPKQMFRFLLTCWFVSRGSDLSVFAYPGLGASWLAGQSSPCVGVQGRFLVALVQSREKTV